MKYYKINQSQADNIGVLEYEPNKFINPYVAKQTDGSYILNEMMYNMLNTNYPLKAATLIALEEISYEDAKANLEVPEL